MQMKDRIHQVHADDRPNTDTYQMRPNTYPCHITDQIQQIHTNDRPNTYEYP